MFLINCENAQIAFNCLLMCNSLTTMGFGHCQELCSSKCVLSISIKVPRPKQGVILTLPFRAKIQGEQETVARNTVSCVMCCDVMLCRWPGPVSCLVSALLRSQVSKYFCIDVIFLWMWNVIIRPSRCSPGAGWRRCRRRARECGRGYRVSSESGPYIFFLMLNIFFHIAIANHSILLGGCRETGRQEVHAAADQLHPGPGLGVSWAY